MDLALLFSSFTARLDGRKITQQRMLYEALRDAILEGLLPAATRLPATRALAKELGIARNSAMFAYEQLAEEGFLDVSRQGSVVARVGAASLLKSTGHKTASARLSRRVDGIRREPPARETPISFRPGLPALDEFPMRPWRAAIARAWRSLDAADLGYANSAGLPDLRHALVDYLKVSRGVRCDVGQVFITDGTQTSLDLCARMLATGSGSKNPDTSVRAPRFRALTSRFCPYPSMLTASHHRRWIGRPHRPGLSTSHPRIGIRLAACSASNGGWT